MDETIWSIAMLVTVAALALVAVVLVVRARRDVRRGLPVQDERSRALSARASYYTLYLSMYLTLALGFVFVLLEDRDMTLPNSELLFILAAAMGSIYIGFGTYLNRKGRGSSG